MGPARQTRIGEGFARVRAAFRQRLVDEEPEVLFGPEPNSFARAITVKTVSSGRLVQEEPLFLA